MAADYFAGGQWNFICDVCGTKTKSADAKKRWDGLMTCGRAGCWEPRQAQDFVRAREEDQSVPFSRPDQNLMLSDNANVTNVSYTVPSESGHAGATVTLSRVDINSYIGSL